MELKQQAEQDAMRAEARAVLSILSQATSWFRFDEYKMYSVIRAHLVAHDGAVRLAKRPLPGVS